MITEFGVTEALYSLDNESTWRVRNGTDIAWDENNSRTQPTDAEITAEITRLQAEFDSKQYARDRAKAYPSLTDQADMAYWDRQNGTTTLDDTITAVKAAYPKI